MVGRRRAAATAFRPSTTAGPRTGPTRKQTVALIAGAVVIAAAIAVASFAVKPSKARSFDLFYGSLFINDNYSPVAVDLASGKPTIGLRNAFTAVSAKQSGDLDVFPLDGGNTLMLDRITGEFNMVDSTGFVVKPTNGGVRLPSANGVSRTTAVAAGDSAYMLKSSPTRSLVFLVSQATVSSAIGVNARAKPRASVTLNRPVADVPVPAASANGDLWLLTDAAGATGGAAAITQLSVPNGSNAGAMLDAHPHGSVTGVAAVASATRNADGTGGEVAAVASGAQIRIFDGTAEDTVRLNLGGPVTEILPASNADGTLAFLYHTADGWTVVTVPPTASAHTARVSRIAAISPSAHLVVPALSDGRLYTMDTLGSGDLWQVEADGSAHRVAGAETYPTLKIEKSDLSQSEVVARGSRVIFNARANYEAEVVFSDGSHAPRTIDKHSAVQVDPSGATALTSAQARAAGTAKAAPPKTAPRPAQPVNDKINCSTSTQTPNIPTLIAGERGSRSVVLTWTYPLLDTSDCVPSTYVVSIKVLTAGSPSPPSRVTVQGQDGVTLTGLFPATQYEMTVTAYINGRGTTSQPIRVSTGPEGPAAPTRVRAATTATGDWTLSWTSCGGVKQGCVPSASWTVVPKFCDGRGLSNAPAPLSVTGDPTVHSFTATYPGNDGTLGRGVCFAVQGVSPQGTAGTVSAFTPAAYSWSPPIAGALRLSASQPATTTLGGTASTDVDLDLGSDPVKAVGGVGASITFALAGPGGTNTKTIVFDGKSDHVATTFPGIAAGARYTASAVVHAPGHPAASASLQVNVTTRAQWPALSASADCASGGGPVVLSCGLTVHINGLSSAAAGGELFTLADNSGVVCGNTGFPLNKADFDPAHEAITQDVNLLNYNGTCTVNLALREGSNQRTPAVFGGTTSPTFSTNLNLGQASTLDATADQFSGKFVTRPGGGAGVQIQFSGSSDAASKLATDWHEQVLAPNGAPCGSDNAPPDDTVAVTPSCVADQGGNSGWQFTISYADKRDGKQHSFGPIDIPGTPPGFIEPCTVTSANFTAQWDPNSTVTTPSVIVTFDPGRADLGGCSNFVYAIQQPPTSTDCSDMRVGDTPPANQAISAIGCDLNAQGKWQIEITYTSARNDARPIDIDVDGNPPK